MRAMKEGMEDLRRRLQALSDPSFRMKALASLAEEARTQIAESFNESMSPYDEPWAPLKTRSGKPLLDTGRLRNSLLPRATGAGLRISVNLVYAATHQYGRGSIPQRQFLPETSRGLGERWTRAFQKTLDSAVRGAGG